MSKHGFMLVADLPKKAGSKRAPVAPAKQAEAGKFVGFTAEEQAFLDGMAKHRANFSAQAVVARSETHRKKS